VPAAQSAPPLADKLARLRAFRDELFDRQGLTDPEARKRAWAAVLAKRGVDSATKLSEAQLDELLAKMGHALNVGQMHDALHGTLHGAAGTEAAPDGAPKSDS
jgi:hypothetical protein